MTHLIRQQYLHLALNGTESEGLALQKRLSDLCHDWLIPAIERALDRCAPPSGHLYIEQLTVDVGEIDLGDLGKDFSEAVARALEAAMRERFPPGGPPAAFSDREAPFRTNNQAVWEAFFYFLKTGRLPWFYRLPAGDTLEQTLRITLSDASALDWAALKATLTQPTARQRLAAQFSDEFLSDLIGQFAPGIPAMVRRVAEEISRGNDRAISQKRIWEASFAHLATGKTATDEKALVARLTEPGPALSDERASHVDADADPIYVDNAGLVLLHPFLPRFFQAAGVAQEDELRQLTRALGLLHFLATGQETAPEHELVLPKILCGLVPETPLEGGVELTETEKAAGIELLEAVIRHWEALRNTSPDGLREAFLRRPGKLSRRDGDWLMQVERRSHDLLLDSLPWNISVFRLPWMPGLLWTEWM